MPGSSDIFLFADFRFDPAGGGLFRCDSRGAFAPVTIGSRALDLLAVLIERRGDVVSKEEIMTAVWPKTAVEEANLFAQISALRAILDKEQSGQSCIQTVIGRGYRFIAPVIRCAGGMNSHTLLGPHERIKMFASSDDFFMDKVDDALSLDDANWRSDQILPGARGSAPRLCDFRRGRFLVKSGNWMNHLEYDWQSPICHVFRRLSREHTSFATTREATACPTGRRQALARCLGNRLETVVDASASSISRALGYPRRRRRRAMQCGRTFRILFLRRFALGGKKRSPAEKEMRDAMTTLMRIGWGADYPSFRQMFTARFIPGGTHEQADYFNELQLKTTSPECAARYFDVVGISISLIFCRE